MYLSKSQFTRGLQCVKSLWLKKYNSGVLTQPDDAQQAVFDTGNRVGDLACRMFPDGTEIPFDRENMGEMISLTRQLLDEECKDIYEATFDYKGIFVMADILHKTPEGWEIYEVKSSTDVKPVYIQDSAVQYFALKGCGLNISKVSVIHINNQYIRGKELEIDKLFTIADVTAQVLEYQNRIPAELKRFEKILEDKESEPDIDIGPHCSDPYPCDASQYCRKQKNIPEYSVLNISCRGSRRSKLWDLYDQGIIRFEDIVNVSVFNASQKMQIECELDKKTVVNSDEIRNFVSSLTYPLYHLDFETFQMAIPEYEGLKPYQQIPSQYSIHIEDGKGGLEHREFLAEEGSDPRRVLAENLVKEIPADVMVLAYNRSFEQGVIKNLAELYPDLSVHLLKIRRNIKDLMVPFQKKHYYSPLMKGSYSIKSVMPALVPEMENAYDELEVVHNGGEAMSVYSTLHLIDDKAEVERLRKGLLDYCRLDTLAMVKILEKLKQ